MVHQYRILTINSSSERQKNYISCVIWIFVTWHKVSSNWDTLPKQKSIQQKCLQALQRLVPQLFMSVNFSLYVIFVMYFGCSYLLGTYAISDMIIGSSLGLYNIPTWSWILYADLFPTPLNSTFLSTFRSISVTYTSSEATFHRTDLSRCGSYDACCAWRLWQHLPARMEWGDPCRGVWVPEEAVLPRWHPKELWVPAPPWRLGLIP